MALGFELKTKSAKSMEVSSADKALCNGGVKIVLETAFCHCLSHLVSLSLTGALRTWP